MTPEHESIRVKCSANYCRYNEDNRCVAENITVGNENAVYRSETQCESFRLK